jgi:hypothetical protein
VVSVWSRAFRMPGKGLFSASSRFRSTSVDVKRCAGRTAAGKPCAAWPLQGTAYCPLHTPGRAAELGRRGGSAGRGSRAWRNRGREPIDIGTADPRNVSLGLLLANEGHGGDESAHDISDEADAGPDGVPNDLGCPSLQGPRRSNGRKCSGDR